MLEIEVFWTIQTFLRLRHLQLVGPRARSGGGQGSRRGLGRGGSAATCGGQAVERQQTSPHAREHVAEVCVSSAQRA